MRHMHRALALVTLLTIGLTASIAFAQAPPAPQGPPDLAALWPMFGLVIAAGWGYLARYFTATKWAQAHNVLGHMFITLVGMLITSVTPVFQAGHVTWAALAWAAVSIVPTFVAGLNHPPIDPGLTPAQAAELALRSSRPSGRASLVVLMVVAAVAFGGALALAGCHGYKSPTYATMTGMAGAAGAAVENLPKICEGAEAQAVDTSKTRGEALQKSGAIHAQCTSAGAVLKTMPDTIQAARDAVHNAPTGADLTAVMPWVVLVVKEYCDVRPLLAAIGYQLPNPGVC